MACTSHGPMMRNKLVFKQCLIVLLLLWISLNCLSVSALFTDFPKIKRRQLWQPIKAILEFRQTQLSNSTRRTIRKTLRWRLYILHVALIRWCFVCKSGYIHRQFYTYSLPFGFTAYGITVHNATKHESSKVDSSRFESMRVDLSRFESIHDYRSVYPASAAVSMCEQVMYSLIYDQSIYTEM